MTGLREGLPPDFWDDDKVARDVLREEWIQTTNADGHRIDDALCDLASTKTKEWRELLEKVVAEEDGAADKLVEFIAKAVSRYADARVDEELEVF